MLLKPISIFFIVRGLSMIDKEAMIKIDFTAKLTENVNPEDSQKIFDI